MGIYQVFFLKNRVFLAFFNDKWRFSPFLPIFQSFLEKERFGNLNSAVLWS